MRWSRGIFSRCIHRNARPKTPNANRTAGHHIPLLGDVDEVVEGDLHGLAVNVEDGRLDGNDPVACVRSTKRWASQQKHIANVINIIWPGKTERTESSTSWPAAVRTALKEMGGSAKRIQSITKEELAPSAKTEDTRNISPMITRKGTATPRPEPVASVKAVCFRTIGVLHPGSTDQCSDLYHDPTVHTGSAYPCSKGSWWGRGPCPGWRRSSAHTHGRGGSEAAFKRILRVASTQGELHGLRRSKIRKPWAHRSAFQRVAALSKESSMRLPREFCYQVKDTEVSSMLKQGLNAAKVSAEIKPYPVVDDHDAACGGKGQSARPAREWGREWQPNSPHLRHHPRQDSRRKVRMTKRETCHKMSECTPYASRESCKTPSSLAIPSRDAGTAQPTALSQKPY